MAISYNVIKEQIDNWDPIGLLISHAPVNEYDRESKEVLNKLSGLPSVCVESLSNVIFDVFIKSFGSDVFNLGIDECEK